MTIIRKKPNVDRKIERQIITGMIVSERFLSGIQTIYRHDVLRSNFANTVAEWCMKYWNTYKKAPGVEIEDIFSSHRSNDLDPDQAEVIEEFLTSISHEYETGDKFNAEYMLDKAEAHFRLSSVESLRFELAKCISGGRVEDAEALVGDFTRIKRTDVQGIDPFNMELISRSLDENSGDLLFKLHGPFGRALGMFERGSLVALIGVSGIGKTWWLMHIALRGLLAGYKVLFVSLEMSEKQMIVRIQHWITGLPSARWADSLLIPVWDCYKNQTGECTKRCDVALLKKDEHEHFYFPKFDQASRDYKVCTECLNGKRKYEFVPSSWFKPEKRKPLDIGTAMDKLKVVKKLSGIRNKRLKIVQFPSGELTMSGLKTYLRNLEYYEDFIPDMIVTDYADKMRPETTSEYRHGLNEIWEGHKGLAQGRHCLVVTGSQSNTVRSGKDSGQGSWAEDIRKLNLIDAGFAINQTPEEKMRCVYRCGVVKQRHDDFDLIGQFMVLNQLKIGRPYLDSMRV